MSGHGNSNSLKGCSPLRGGLFNAGGDLRSLSAAVKKYFQCINTET